MMKVTYACLIILTYVCFSRGTDPPPMQSVKCDEKGTLNFTLLTSSPWKIQGNATCGGKTNIQITSTADARSIVGCDKETNVTFEINHQHTDDSSDKVSIIPTEESMSVTLRCDAIQSDTNMDAHVPLITVSATYSVQPIRKNVTEDITMVMELRDNTDSHTVTTSINLSQNYILLIAGAGDHNTEVTNCTAAKTSTRTEEVLIYDRSSPNISPQVLTAFTSSGLSSEEIGGKTVNQKATLTGFRLVSSPTVYLKCSIRVCANACTTAVTRKRKGGKHQPKVHYATLKLSVRDNVFDTPMSGAADAFPVASILWRSILMGILLLFIY